jgi:glycogen debranching enzyme
MGLARAAHEVLNGNWLGTATRPGPRLYPHQWSWDSAFTAIGWSHVQWERAATELRTLFAAQWPNGMLPHIVFHDGAADYFPGPEVWDTPHAFGRPRTSGIVQPPVHATAARMVADRAPTAQAARAFLAELFEPLGAWHDYLYRERDLDGEGLVAMRHPWESGQDDSPAWDGALAAIPLDPSGVSPYRRVDLTLVHADERPDPADYDHYVQLIECFKRHRYDEAAMRAECPFWVVAPLFNSALALGGEDLAVIAERLGEDPAPFAAQAARTTAALNERLWMPELGLYVAYDRRRRRHLPAPVAGCFSPLITAATGAERVDLVIRTVTSSRFWPPAARGRGITSYDRRAPGFSRHQYWRGPVWVNINWGAVLGLRRHGRDDLARALTEETLDLVREHGFWEYYDPDTGDGLGSEEFSWTAALVLDLLATHEEL